MPNTPMLVGRGMAAVCAGAHASSADVAKAIRLLGCCAQVIRVTEDQMDAVTAVSGSGPAYFFYLTELLAAAAAEVGLRRMTRACWPALPLTGRRGCWPNPAKRPRTCDAR